MVELNEQLDGKVWYEIKQRKLLSALAECLKCLDE